MTAKIAFAVCGGVKPSNFICFYCVLWRKAKQFVVHISSKHNCL